MKYTAYRAHCPKCQIDFYSKTFTVEGKHYCTECGNVLTVSGERLNFKPWPDLATTGAVILFKQRGMTIRAIASQVGIDKNKVYRILKEYQYSGRQ